MMGLESVHPGTTNMHIISLTVALFSRRIKYYMVLYLFVTRNS